MPQDWVQSASQEHRFWLQVLGDHARFIRDTLAPTEEDKINRAKSFITLFDQLLEQSRSPLTDEQWMTLTIEAERAACAIREFKLEIIREHLVGDVSIELTPTFLNHMVNEVEEYIRLLQFFLRGECPTPCHPLHHHLVWLLDAAGHADGITGSLDMVEYKRLKESKKFTKTFKEFYLKAVEMAGYLRANVYDFPALKRFNHQVELEIKIFRSFLEELEEMGLTNQLLTTLSPLMADHMAREECYYLMKLAESGDINKPDCDPAKPRTEK